MDHGVPEGEGQLATTATLAFGVILLSFLANFVAKRFIVRAVAAIIRRTEVSWDDMLLKRQVFNTLSHLAPGMVIYSLADVVFPRAEGITSLIQRGAVVYMAVVTAWVLDSFVTALNDIYDTLEIAKQRPIKSYVQVVKIIIYTFTAIFLISSVIGRSPVVLLSGLGALSAVLLLVFKDSILGLVASIQLSANDMVRKGDWIEVSKYGADGDVIDISLTTIRVQNFDKTITTVPSYALISDSFRNWRGMQESGGRRIKRAIYVDIGAVRFLEPRDIEALSRIGLIRGYLEAKRAELSRENGAQQADLAELCNGRRLTNLGTFRAYAEAYLRAHPKIEQQGKTLMVRQLAPSDKGVGIELYCFVADTNWVRYEAAQADIFDHLLAVLPRFFLHAFQQPSGRDLRALRGEEN